ncbi:MAG: type V CRISPR-associated protein C2c8 [Xenococcus sp. (in: cyanobacteria)]
MKTVEFKLKLNNSQQTIIDSWLESMRWVWNEGLSLLLEYHHHKYYDWLDKKIEDHDYRRCHLRFSKRNAFAASCPIAVGRDANPVCPTPIPEPRLKYDNYKGLVGYITKTRYPDHLQGIPTKFVAGTLKHLAESWKAYKDKKRDIAHLPKFKSKQRGDKITSLYCIQPQKIKVLENGIKCPGSKLLGELSIVNKNLKKRWDNKVQARTLQIVKRASGYYLQLAGNIPERVEKPSNKACGLDVGLQYIYSDDVGKQIDPPRYYRKQEKRLRRLQRKLARQTKDSKNSLKTKQKIALTHEKTKLQRRAFNHKLSTYLVRTFDAIAVEDIKIANLNRRPKPKKREDGKGWEHNNAKAKSGLNKSFADAGLGQLLTMIETKAKAHNKEFIKVKPHYTSQDCPKCGNRQKKSLSQRTHRCAKCNYIAPRDVAAAINIRSKADFVRSYPTLIGEVKPVKVVQSTSVQQESILMESGCDASTISPPREENNRKQKKKCAVQEVCQSQAISNQPKSLILSSLEGNFTRKSRTRKLKSPPTGQTTSPIQLELDLWNPAGEASSNTH